MTFQGFKNFYPKVLVAIPTYEGKDYVFKENFQAIKNLDYPNYSYIYIDNSAGSSYLSTLRRRGAKAVRVPRGGNSRQALCNAQNYARKKCLDEGYDFLMFIESDLVPTPDAITRLMSYGERVVGATYYIGHEIKVPCIFFTMNKQGVLGTRLIHPKEVPEFLNTGLRKVHGMGLGCTLIRRDVVEKYVYWHDERFDNKHSDVYFYMQLWNDLVPVFVDTNYIIPHYPSKWENVKDR